MPEHIQRVAARVNIPAEALRLYGDQIAKLNAEFLGSLETQDRSDGKLVLVTAMSPTKFGEGKTLTAIGLGDALNRIGKHTITCLREPSLGPVFGLKGGATGGGLAQVIPSDEINLHFTGDFHAVTAAHNLLAALIDNRHYWQPASTADIRWRRVLDMNDRSLRHIESRAGQSGFDITPASEIMAVLCLARDMDDLKARLARIVVGYEADGSPLYASDYGAVEAMAVLLREAFQPNLVQSLEGNPVLVHGGPFANIAHGCNSLRATRAALQLSDLVVTEAGFGADLGAEKFFNITCRAGELLPAAAVVVATVRALKIQGVENLQRHLQNIHRFGVPAVVAINRFDGDSEEDIEAIVALCTELGVPAVTSDVFHRGGVGAEALAETLVAVVDEDKVAFTGLYDANDTVEGKIDRVARDIYGAGEVTYTSAATAALDQIAKLATGLPVCMAKTPYSFTTDPEIPGAPTGHTVEVKQVSLANGAGYVVVNCGRIIKMPGLPKEPAALNMSLEEDGVIRGI